MQLILFIVHHPPGRALYLLEVDRVALPDDGKMFASVNDHARLPSRNHF